MTTPDFSFEEKSHEYRYKGHRLFSVTESFVRSGIVDTTWFTAESAQRGSAAHAACDLYDQDDLDEESLHETIVPYLSAWKQFRKDSGFKPIVELCEKADVHPVWLYGGKWDRVGTIGKDLWLLELKTGQLTPMAELQSAAYVKLPTLNDLHPKRAGLQLCPDGRYKFREFKNLENDFDVFLANLNLARWKVANGLTTKEIANVQL